MGVIGTGILENDFAADAYAEFLGLVEDGTSPRRAVRMMVKDADLDDDPYETCPFWLGIALAQVESGRLTRRVRKTALRIIDSGMDLAIWESDSPGDVADRRAALMELRERIIGPQVRPTRMSRPPKDGLDWEAGDVFAYRLRSGKWTALRLDEIEGQRTREGTFELYDLSVSEIPTPDHIAIAEFRLSEFAKSEISNIQQRSIEALGLFGPKLERIQNAKEEEWRNTIVPELIQEATISGARISLLLKDLNAVGPDRLERIARGVNRTPPGWFSCHCYADDLDTVLEREFGLA